MKPILPSDIGLIDVDGVLAGLDDRVWELVRELGLRSDCEPYPEHQQHRYSTDHLRRADRKHIVEAIKKPGFFETLPVMAGAVEGVERLLAACEKVGTRLVVATKPLPGSRTSDSEKRRWLHDSFPALAEDAIFIPNKASLHGAFLLDDAIKPAWAAVASWKPVVFDRPYNGAGSQWEHWDRWTWTDPLADLHPMFRNLRDDR